MDHCVCVNEWLNKMTQLLNSVRAHTLTIWVADWTSCSALVCRCRNNTLIMEWSIQMILLFVSPNILCHSFKAVQAALRNNASQREVEALQASPSFAWIATPCEMLILFVSLFMEVSPSTLRSLSLFFFVHFPRYFPSPHCFLLLHMITCNTEYCALDNYIILLFSLPDGMGGEQQSMDVPPEQMLMLVPLVLMFVTFLVMSGRHFSQRRERRREAAGDQKVGGGHSPHPPQPPVD